MSAYRISLLSIDKIRPTEEANLDHIDFLLQEATKPRNPYTLEAGDGPEFRQAIGKLMEIIARTTSPNKSAMIDRRWLAALAASAVLAPLLRGRNAAAQTPSTQGWPGRVVKLVVPFTPGGGIDSIGRILGARLSEMYSRPPWAPCSKSCRRYSPTVMRR